MFGSLGVPEMLFILGLALLVFGPKRLPELGRTIGRALGEFRRASTDLRRSFNSELAMDEESPRRPALAPDPPSRSQGAQTTIAAPVPAAGAEPRTAAPAAPGDAEEKELAAAGGVGAIRAPGAATVEEPPPAVEQDAPAVVPPVGEEPPAVESSSQADEEPDAG